MKTNPKVDFYFSKAGRWQTEINLLRSIVLNCGLVENLKWGVPCYTLKNSKIVLIHIFKNYCALLFFKGVLLNDVDRILIQQTANVQAARQIRFKSFHEIDEMETKITAYIQNAIDVDEAGLKVELKKTAEFAIPDEFQRILNEMPTLRTAFGALTPGRQRAYLLHFSAPKQSKTRVSRVEKCIPQILVGKGLDART